MHIFHCIFVQFMQFHILDFGLDHFTSQAFNYSDTTLRRETGETSAPHFHQLTSLRVVIPIKSLLV